MKKIFVLACLVATSITANAQASKAIDAKEIVWYGLDFTKARFVGQFDQGMGAAPASGMDIKNKWIGQWNNLIGKEPQNFKIKEAFQKDNVYYDMSGMAELNNKIDPGKIMVFNATKLDQKEIDGMVKNYKPGDKKEGVGLSFIIESFDKGTETATMYVTFFDIATDKVLLTHYMSGHAAGAGMRNYWAGAIKSVLKQLSKEEDYKNWK
jgi:hypothetical protein